MSGAYPYHFYSIYFGIIRLFSNITSFVEILFYFFQLRFGHCDSEQISFLFLEVNPYNFFSEVTFTEHKLISSLSNSVLYAVVLST